MKRSRRVFLVSMGIAALTSPLAVTSALTAPYRIAQADLPPVPPPPPPLPPGLEPLPPGRGRRRLGAGG